MNATVNKVVLVADVGGTNLNLALLQEGPGGLRLLRKARLRTQETRTLLEPVLGFLGEDPACRPERACISGAGPVVDGRIRLTNAPWDIEGPELQAALGIPVKVVNDFIALSAGTRHLDLADPAQVTPLPHGDGTLPAPDPDGVVLVVGAGTGLGVGFLVPGTGGPRICPSEGGHLGLPIFDADSRELHAYLSEGLSGPPGAELAVSGPGLARILAFLVETGREATSPGCAALLAQPEQERAAGISALAGTDPACAHALRFFVDLYARVCADLCAAFLPSGGIFLAGGIAAKNEAWFLQEGRFMARFERNYREHLDQLARRTPVFLTRDYDLSLYGAALA